jgi:hypothetical protein
LLILQYQQYPQLLVFNMYSIFAVALLSVLLSNSRVGLASVGPCPSEYPCAETYPANVSANAIEVGVLTSVDVNEPWALALRAFIETTIDEVNEDPK